MIPKSTQAFDQFKRLDDPKRHSDVTARLKTIGANRLRIEVCIASALKRSLIVFETFCNSATENCVERTVLWFLPYITCGRGDRSFCDVTHSMR